MQYRDANDGRISVIIPTYQEQVLIGTRLQELAGIPGLAETIVVDGGSTDRTVEIARSSTHVTVIEAPRSRASQMNAGARMATGDILLFLHADVSLPRAGPELIRAALTDRQVVAGAFRTWTVSDGVRSWLTPLLHLADLRSRYTRFPYGDQAMFVRAKVFRDLGGYPEQPLMEDLELCRKLRRMGRILTVRECVRVSGRRFLARPIYYTVTMNLFPLLYRLGVPSRLLAGFYNNPR